jgi:hypothetical protein
VRVSLNLCLLTVRPCACDVRGQEEETTSVNGSSSDDQGQKVQGTGKDRTVCKNRSRVLSDKERDVRDRQFTRNKRILKMIM